MIQVRNKYTRGITMMVLVITIIVLLILGGVTIATLTGRNGILNNTNKAKQETLLNRAEEKVKIAISGSYDTMGKFQETEFQTEVARMGGISTINGMEAIVEIEEYSFWVDLAAGKIEQIQTGPVQQPENTPEHWKVIRRTDEQWYSYMDLTNNTKVKVNPPRLKGNMMPIKYQGEEQQGSKWANAMTTDGSMWVWIPRYAYKITESYHTNVEGTIEIAFLDTYNNFLNDSDTGTIETDPSKITYTGDSQDQWLVHPAFTANAENGGGFGEITGIWVAKFETSRNTTTNLATKPGVSSLRIQTINQFYRLAKETKYEETENLKSHMMKNSEWGAVTYLSYSKYGRNKEKITFVINTPNYYTGGSTDTETIYVANKNQSTTNNATGIYDIGGSAWEAVASYIGNQHINLQNYGGTTKDDLYGETEEERMKSTEYKTVYKIDSSDNRANNYQVNHRVKGDAIYETSSSSTSLTGWGGLPSNFPYSEYPFFGRGGIYPIQGIFSFSCYTGNRDSNCSFHLVLVTDD